MENRVFEDLLVLFENADMIIVDCRPIKIRGVFDENYLDLKSNKDEDKNLLLDTCFDEIVPCVEESINSFKASNESCTNLKMFTSSKDTVEEEVIYLKSNNIIGIHGSDVNKLFLIPVFLNIRKIIYENQG